MKITEIVQNASDEQIACAYQRTIEKFIRGEEVYFTDAGFADNPAMNEELCYQLLEICNIE